MQFQCCPDEITSWDSKYIFVNRTIQDNVIALKKKIDGNVYIKDETDIKNAHAIIDLYANYPKHYVKMMLSRKHKDRY